jgi:hypothetical protein
LLGQRNDHLAAARLKLAAAISYHGGGINTYLDERPRSPIMFHYGELGSHIPLSVVEIIKETKPEGHFSCIRPDTGSTAPIEPASMAAALN